MQFALAETSCCCPGKRRKSFYARERGNYWGASCEPCSTDHAQRAVHGPFLSLQREQQVRSNIISWMLTIWWLNCSFYWYFWLCVGLQMITGLLYSKLTPGWLKKNVMMQIQVPSSRGPGTKRVQGRKPLSTCWISGAWTLLWWAECEEKIK